MGCDSSKNERFTTLLKRESLIDDQATNKGCDNRFIFREWIVQIQEFNFFCLFMNSQPFRCLITAGPTREYIDPVRFLSNPSSGKMGYALAKASIEKGWQVDLVSGPVHIQAPVGVSLHHVVSGKEMLEACKQLFPQCDMLIMCAAVMDMHPKRTFQQKQKKDRMEWNIEFEPVIDILKNLSSRKTHQTMVGFAAETENIETHALRKLAEKKLDWIVANDVSGTETGFESDLNRVEVFHKKGKSFKYGPESKIKIAKSILSRITIPMDTDQSS